MRLWGIQHYDLWTMFNLLICFVYYKYSAFLVLILQLKCTMLVGLESGERVLWPLADGNWGLMGGLGGWMRTRMGKRWTCRKDYKVIILSGGSLSMLGKLCSCEHLPFVGLGGSQGVIRKQYGWLEGSCLQCSLFFHRPSSFLTQVKLKPFSGIHILTRQGKLHGQVFESLTAEQLL